MDRSSEVVVLIEKAAEIVVAYLARADVSPRELVELVRGVRQALNLSEESTNFINLPEPDDQIDATVLDLLSETGGADRMEKGGIESPPVPAVPVSESIRHDYILSLEDGRPFRSLRRHLMAKYGMTPDDYRRKWGLPNDYPMVAPRYAEERSQVAKRIGLGRSKASTAQATRSSRKR